MQSSPFPLIFSLVGPVVFLITLFWNILKLCRI
jgi:hypothetical protein